MQKLNERQEESGIHTTEIIEEKIKSENKVNYFFVLTFMLYIVFMTGIRVAAVLSLGHWKRLWSAASPPWDAFQITVSDVLVFLLHCTNLDLD
jgi:hypothetical protein